jgi:putative hemolysin
MEAIIAILTLLLSFFFSGMEIAFLTSNRLRIELKTRQGHRGAKLLSRFRKRTSEILVTILIGNNLALVIFANMMENLTSEKLDAWLGVNPDSTYLTYTLIQSLMTTIIVLVMAEYIPKAIFRSNADIVVYPLSHVLNFFYRLLYGPVWLVNAISKFLLKVFFRVPTDEKMVPLDTSDLDHYLLEVVAESEDTPVPDLDTEMLTNALAFRETKARECMIPRTQISAAPLDISVDELLSMFIETQLSKIIIFEENLDNIKGIIHSISMFEKPSNIRGLIQPVLIVPETMPANAILGELTNTNRSVAIVVDEYGGTSGMITVEDLVEEVFGEIEDEHDYEKEEEIEDDMVMVKNEDGSFTLGARLEIDDLNEEFDLKIPGEEYYTSLGGYILYKYEDIPQEGDVVQIDQFLITVLEAMQNKIIKVRLELATPADVEEYS